MQIKPSVIDFEHITKRYGAQVALADLNFNVARGEIFGLVGRNGAGKTTTLAVLMGFVRATGGRARVLGLDPWIESTVLHEHTAWLPGEVRLPEAITASGWLAYQARVAHIAIKAIEDLAKTWEVPLDRPIRTLSKGNRQKVALLRLLASNAELLVLDEPTSGLDPVAQEMLFAALRTRAAQGSTIIFSSHNLAEVSALCNRIGVIDLGRVIAVGTVAELTQAGQKRLEVWTREPIDIAQFDNLKRERVLTNHLASGHPDPRHLTLVGDRLLEEELVKLLPYGVERVEFGGTSLDQLLVNLHRGTDKGN